MTQATGFLEAEGYVSIFNAVDAMAKSTEVTVSGVVKLGGGLVAVSVVGDLATVEEAISLGEAAISAGGTAKFRSIVFANPWGFLALAAVPALLNALERRDAELRQYAVEVLQAILKHQVPFDAFAPEAARKTHDLSSLEIAIHAAAPCPVQVKEQMIQWWGPIIDEYYGATEGLGFTGRREGIAAQAVGIARAAFEAYDIGWNGIETYINIRSRELYTEIEVHYQAGITKGLNAPTPDAAALLARLHDRPDGKLVIVTAITPTAAVAPTAVPAATKMSLNGARRRMPRRPSAGRPRWRSSTTHATARAAPTLPMIAACTTAASRAACGTAARAFWLQGRPVSGFQRDCLAFS